MKRVLKISFYSFLAIASLITLWFTAPLKFRTETEYGFKLPESASLNWQILSPKRTLDKIGLQTNSDFPFGSSTKFMIDTNELDILIKNIESFSCYAHKPPILKLDSLKKLENIKYHVIPNNQREFSSYLFIKLKLEKELISVTLATSWN